MAIRVYQVAKEYSRTPEEILHVLKDAGIEVASQTAVLDEHALHTVRAKFGKFKITVVEGDHVSQVTRTDEAKAKEPPKKAAAKSTSKKKSVKKAANNQPKPRLAVRVIKKKEDHEEEEPLQAATEPDTQPEEPAKPKLRPKPRLKRSTTRSRELENRIHKLAEQRTHQRDGGPAAETAPSTPSENPATQDESPAPTKAPPSQRLPEKRKEKPFPMAVGSQAPDNRRGPSDRSGRPGGPSNRPYRSDQGRGGDRQGGYSRGGHQGRGPGGPGRGPGGPGRGPGGPGRGPGGPGRGPGGPGGPGRGGPGGPGRGGPGGPGRGGPGGPGRGGPGGPGRGGPGGPGRGGPMPPAPGRPQRRGGPGRPMPKRKKRRRRENEQLSKIRPSTVKQVDLPEEELGIIMLSEGVTVKELSEKVNRKAKDVIKRLFEKGIMATLNHVLDTDLAIEIAKDFGYLAEIVSFEEDLEMRHDELIAAGELEGGDELKRAPIVTIMGHVDHGKTTLLDTIRKTKVASGEAGGITQHIGAYSVPCGDQDIVFLDTPGHEAFTKMRARGASVTDIVIIVVAADDGVKPQTVEAINHAKAAKVPIIVCVNKIDKPEANPDRVKQMLTEHEIIVEEFGGDSPCVQVSAKQGQGIDELLEMILLVAELQDYKAIPTRKAKGTVIEARLDRGRGPVATIIVQDGTLNVGNYFITGSTYGKIRAMHDDLGQKIKIAPPSTPVEILGLQEVPASGDSFQVVADEATARQIAGFRKDQMREDQFRRQKHTTLDQLFNKLNKDEVKELPLILKSDVHGSLEGLAFALNKIKSDKVQLRFVHQGVGNITENDVLLAVAADAIIIGFNVKSERKAQELADQEQIDVRLYSVIYDVVNDIETAMLGLLAPEVEEVETGKAYVKQIFAVNKLGNVAGCYVESGFVRKDSHVRVMRGENEVFKGEIQTLKRFRDDVNEVKSGLECGIGLRNFSEFREQDQLVFISLQQVRPTKL